MPSHLAIILNSPITFIDARVIVTTLFWSEGILGLVKFPMFVDAIGNLLLPFPRMFATIVIITNLGGSLLMITNVDQLGWVDAGVLGAFTLLTIPYGHAFWKFSEPRRTQELFFTLEHVSVVGGLLLAAILFPSHSERRQHMSDHGPTHAIGQSQMETRPHARAIAKITVQSSEAKPYD